MTLSSSGVVRNYNGLIWIYLFYFIRCLRPNCNITFFDESQYISRYRNSLWEGIRQRYETLRNDFRQGLPIENSWLWCRCYKQILCGWSRNTMFLQRVSIPKGCRNGCSCTTFKLPTRYWSSLSSFSDTEIHYKQAISDIAKTFNKVYTPEVVNKIVGTPQTETCKIAIREMNLPLEVEQFRSLFVKLSYRRMHNVPLLPGQYFLVCQRWNNKSWISKFHLILTYFQTFIILPKILSVL